MGVGVAFQPQRRIAGHQPGQVLGQRVLVGAGLGHHRDRQQRLGHRPRLHEQRVVPARQSVAGLRAARLGDRADVPGDARADLTQLGAERRVDVCDPFVGVVVGVSAFGHAVPGDVHGELRAQCAGEDPDQRDPADVPVDRRLDHLGDQRAVRVAGQRRTRRAVHPSDRGQVVLQRRRGTGDQAVEQRVQADTGLRAHRNDRVEMAARDRLLQVGDQHVRADLLAAQITVHQGLVLALGDDPLDELVAVLLHRRQVGALGLADLRRIALRVVQHAQGDQPQQAGHGLPVVGEHGLVDRQHVLAERLLAVREGLVEVGARMVEAGDRHRTRHAYRGALVPERGGGGVHAVDRRDDEERGVRGPQAGAQLTDEVGISGSVQEVDLHALVRHGRAGEGDGPLLAYGGWIVIGHRGAFGHRAGPRNRASGGEQRLHQRRLPGSGVADQHHVANSAGVGHRRRCSAGHPFLRSLLRHG